MSDFKQQLKGEPVVCPHGGSAPGKPGLVPWGYDGCYERYELSSEFPENECRGCEVYLSHVISKLGG